jgi:Mor family transcriptional regulator
MAKRTIKINIKLPAGVTATPALEAKANAAALTAIKSATKDMAALQKIAKELSSKGIEITPEELLARKKGSSAAKKSAPSKKVATRKRVVLTPAQKKALIVDLKAGSKTAALVKKYGVSVATIMNVKAAAKLTKRRKK